MAESYEAYERDVTQRISHSETRIKYWVIAGVVANLLVLIGVGVPMVYYLGQMSAQATEVIASVAKTSMQLDKIEVTQRRQAVWQYAAEQWMQSQGFLPPPPHVGVE